MVAWVQSCFDTERNACPQAAAFLSRRTSAKSMDLIGHKFLSWRELDGWSVTKPSSLCEGCCLQDYEYLALPHTHAHAHEHIIMLMGLLKINHMISLIPRLVPAYAWTWEWGYHIKHKTVASLLGTVQLSVTFSTYCMEEKMQREYKLFIKFNINRTILVFCW